MWVWSCVYRYTCSKSGSMCYACMLKTINWKYENWKWERRSSTSWPSLIPQLGRGPLTCSLNHSSECRTHYRPRPLIPPIYFSVLVQQHITRHEPGNATPPINNGRGPGGHKRIHNTTNDKGTHTIAQCIASGADLDWNSRGGTTERGVWGEAPQNFFWKLALGDQFWGT